MDGEEPSTSGSSLMRLRNPFIGEQNAMLNPVVLSVLFEVCPRTELKNYRLVCKTWKNISLDRWRRDMPLTITHKPRVVQTRQSSRTYYGSGTNQKGISMEELEQLMIVARRKKGASDVHKLLTKPFQKYSVSCMYSLNLADDTVGRFWKEFGPKMKQLELTRVEDDSELVVRQLESIMFEKTPNLEKLVIMFDLHVIVLDSIDRGSGSDNLPVYRPQRNLKSLEVWIGRKSDGGQFPIRWEDVLLNYPNLETVKLIARGDFHREFGLNDFLGAVNNIRVSNPSSISLKHLDIMDVRRQAIMTFPESSMDLLKNLRVPLTTLKIDLGMKTAEPRVKQMLEAYAPTLRILHVFRGPSATPFDNFPFGIYFDSLDELKIYGPTVKTFGFLHYTPNLKTLHLFRKDHIHCAKRHSVLWPIIAFPGFLQCSDNGLIGCVTGAEFDDISLPRMEEFRGDFRLEDPVTFRNLTKWMPRLKRLEMKLNPDLFPIACDGWGNTLEELRLLPGTVLNDDVFTGVPQRQNRSGRQRLAPTSCHRSPNITNFTKLRYFNLLTVDHHDHINELTAHSFTHGLEHVPNLESLKMYMAEDQVRKLDMVALKEKIREVDISPNPVGPEACGGFEIQKRAYIRFRIHVPAIIL